MTAALILTARNAVAALRDAAREGRMIGFRERDELVLAIHRALDLAVTSPSPSRETVGAMTEPVGTWLYCPMCRRVVPWTEVIGVGVLANHVNARNSYVCLERVLHIRILRRHCQPEAASV